MKIKMTTTIQISDELWEILNKKRKRGETFEDVLKREINTRSAVKKTKDKSVLAGEDDSTSHDDENK